jgi:hypothetical protein
MRYYPLTPFRYRHEGVWLVLESPFEVAYVYRGRSRVRKLRPGFRWNGCSVPPALHWWHHPLTPWTAPASALHDETYRRKDISRMEADALFLAALVYDARRMYPVLAQSGWRRRFQRCRLARKLRQARIMYRAVRVFGVAFWG